MTVMILERVSPSLRGQLSRWLIEIHTGVFVGRISAQVRQLLWEMVCDARKDGSAVLVYQTNSEQGFRIEISGERSRNVRDFEGLQLVTIQQ